MRISDWSSDVCSSDLEGNRRRRRWVVRQHLDQLARFECSLSAISRGLDQAESEHRRGVVAVGGINGHGRRQSEVGYLAITGEFKRQQTSCCRSEEHTSELPSLMRISYAVFCLNK